MDVDEGRDQGFRDDVESVDPPGFGAGLEVKRLLGPKGRVH